METITHPHYGIPFPVEETWAWIPSYEGLYQVSTWGRVRAVARRVPHRHIMMALPEKILSPWLGGDRGQQKYQWVTIYRLKVARKIQVHRLVLEVFIGPCPGGMECCHFPDRDRHNNRVVNLRWATRKDNVSDRLKHGVSSRAKSYAHVPRGDSHHRAKLSEAVVRRIKPLLAGDMPRGGLRQMARQLGISISSLCDVRKGRTWRHV